MSGESTTTLTPLDEDDGELGRRFWLRVFGGVVVLGIVLFIALLIFWRALYAWGFLGVVLFIAVASLVFGWIYDRRRARKTAVVQ